jgi:hypothetical protein
LDGAGSERTPEQGISDDQGVHSWSGSDAWNADAGAVFTATTNGPFGPLANSRLRERVRTLTADGRYELFKTTTKYDGKVGREQHHYPPQEKLPA